MSLLKKLNSRAKTEANTGFGNNPADYGGRFVNKNGQPNIDKRGVGVFEKISWYHTLLQLPRWKFLLMLIIFYTVINFLFANIYYFIGVEHLEGLTATTEIQKFGEAFFFSAQTFTTVGYGRISPVGFITSAIAAFEALIGLLSFAIATGLFYGRFSRPKAYLRFSDNMILAPFKDGLAIMMRVASYKNNNLTDAEAKVIAGLMIEENGKTTNKFFRMDLEYNTVNALTLSWTIVHPINENSPFYKFSLDDYKSIKGEVLLFIKAFDDMFSNTVVARTSYTLDELIIGAKFVPMFHRSSDNGKTILEIEKLNSYVPADINSLLS
ncbi:Ion transport 2 domain protein [Ferruginibacter lapsinanis]|uniref:ion channel n=1 Tax=Ferruginibacter lapsinanis TaxID=563172 RepID=UPI001E30E709|nr:ion channel [Ferruginibacter lapsinanis]UEG49579.1 Ion transport 2 domain protein [Ferruginibacter lapsinanis]